MTQEINLNNFIYEVIYERYRVNERGDDTDSASLARASECASEGGHRSRVRTANELLAMT
jgi:hypothetical protein